MKKSISTWLIIMIVCGISSVGFSLTDEEVAKIQNAAPDKAPVKPARPRKMLVFNLCQGYKHKSIPYVDKALEIIGEKTGAYTTVSSDDMSVFNAEYLAQFDAVCFNNTTRLTFDDPSARKALMDFVKGGKGIVGIHAATDNFYNWPEAAEMMGGLFVSHPWGAGGTWDFKIDEPTHPINAAFEGKPFQLSDEIYLVRQLKLRDNAKILLSLDMTDPVNLKAGFAPDVPVSWVRDFGRGRVFYCSLGHNFHVLWTPYVLEHYLAGIQFAMGDLDADTTPSDSNTGLLDVILAQLRDYDYHKAKEPVYLLDEYVRSAQNEPAAARQAERRLIEFLESKPSPAAMQHVCRRLFYVSSGACVPVLEKMLITPETVEMARLALAPIDDLSAGRALREALMSSKVSETAKVGIIGSLGQRGDRQAVDKIAELLDLSVAMRKAGLHALGLIATEQAEEVIEGYLKASDPSVRADAMHAYETLAGALAKKGENREAFEAYEELYENRRAGIQNRSAALIGMANTNPRQAADIVEDILEDEDHPMLATAITLIGTLKIEDADEYAEELMEDLSPALQVLLVNEIGKSDIKSAVDAVLFALQEGEPVVQVAALRSLAEVGDAEHVEQMAQYAAEGSGAVAQQARESLAFFHAPGTDAEIMDLLEESEGAIQQELIAAVSRRNMTQATGLLMDIVSQGDRRASVDAAKALADVAGPGDMAGILDLIEESDSTSVTRQLENTAVTVAKKAKGDMSAPVRKALMTASDEKYKQSLYGVLGGIADEGAYQALAQGLSSSSDPVRVACIRALSQWPNAAPLNELRELARHAQDPTEKTLALRGYINQIGLAEAGANEKIAMFEDAMSIASQDQQKRAILSGIGQLGTWEGYQFARKYRHSSLDAEASLAMVQNAEKIYTMHYSQIEPDLRGIVKEAVGQSIKDQAGKVLAEIEKIETYVTAWMVSGPYLRVAGDSADQILGHVYPPENNAANGEWNAALAKHFEPNMLGVLNFMRIFPGNDRAAYVKTMIFSPSRQQAVLEVHSDDGVKIWLNGEMIHENNVRRGITSAGDKVDLTLNKGENALMVKVYQASGGWAVSVRVTDTSGNAIKGLRYEAR